MVTTSQGNSPGQQPRVRFPQTAVYTVNTHGYGNFQRWPGKEAAISFLKQSTYYAQQHFSKVVLYADSQGAALLKDVLFDEVHVTLDCFDINPGIRGACKLDTYARQKTPFVHMDWDFVLWRMVADRFRTPVVAQSRMPDHGKTNIGLLFRSLPWKPNFIDPLVAEYSEVDLVCPSILGGMDVDFLAWYAELALEILRHPRNYFLQELAQGPLEEDVCLAIEQWLLGACALYMGVAVNYLCEEPTHEVNSLEPRNIQRLGFTHLGGKGKYSEYWTQKIRERNFKAGLLNSTAAVLKTKEQGGDVIDLKAIPYKVLVSMENHQERRREAQEQFQRLGIDVEWKIPVKIQDIQWNATTLRYRLVPVAASRMLTLLDIFSEVERRKVDYFIHFEDDVVFHPEITALLPEIRVPQDWKFIYIGGRNCGDHEYVSRGLIRSDFISDIHAVIIRADIIDPLRRALMDPCINSVWPDFRFATLQNIYPAYLCRPNLAWQSSHSPESGGTSYSHYNEDGTVKEGMGN